MSRILLVLLLLYPVVSFGDTVEYEFDIGTRSISITGTTVEALAIDGQIPAPTIRAGVGDTLRVTFNNHLDQTTSVHWHGILLPAEQDGVPFLNTQPIAPGGSHTFEFPILHHGTFWYHSHTDLQIQKGLYGGIVLSKPDAPAMEDRVVVLSDWIDEAPGTVLANLKKSDDFYAWKKEKVQSWDRVIANGGPAIRNRIASAFTRMGPMDLTDVAYDAFLLNGQREASLQLDNPRAELVKLRLINGSTSSYFDVEYAGGPMTVIAADGQDVEPIRVQRLRITTAETYDVLVPAAPGQSFELRASSFDGTGYGSLFVGTGERVTAPDIAAPNLHLMDHSTMDMPAMDMPSMQHTDMPMPGSSTAMDTQTRGDSSSGHSHAGDPPSPMQEHSHVVVEDTEHQGSDPASHRGEDNPMDSLAISHNPADQAQQHGQGILDNTVQNSHIDHAQAGPAHSGMEVAGDTEVIPHLSDYRHLVALVDTSLPDHQPWRVIEMRLTGNMERYVWSFNGKTGREDPLMAIQAGENIRLHLTNETMMHHPLHLHGHFFRVVNGNGQRSPLKHTVDVPPMGRVTIEFDASEEQDWLFHCHNQYHMKAGMNRVVGYEQSSNFTAELGRQVAPSRRWFNINEFHLLTSFMDYEMTVSDERHAFDLELDADLEDTMELHLFYSYQFNRFVSGFGGLERRQHHHGKSHDLPIAGLNVLLPFMVESEWRVDDHGRFRLELESDLQLTRRLGFDWRWNSDEEHRYGFNYRLSNRLSVTVHTDTEYGNGFGVQFFY